MKPRNHVVLALIRSNKKAGSHTISVKAKRLADKNQLKKSLQKNQWF